MRTPAAVGAAAVAQCWIGQSARRCCLVTDAGARQLQSRAGGRSQFVQTGCLALGWPDARNHAESSGHHQLRPGLEPGTPRLDRAVRTSESSICRLFRRFWRLRWAQWARAGATRLPAALPRRAGSGRRRPRPLPFSSGMRRRSRRRSGRASRSARLDSHADLEVAHAVRQMRVDGVRGSCSANATSWLAYAVGDEREHLAFIAAGPAAIAGALRLGCARRRPAPVRGQATIRSRSAQ
jgi:hypothetical protein